MGKWFSKQSECAKKIESFIHKHPERHIGLSELHEILGLYENWRKLWFSYESDPCERYVLHYIAEKAFWSDIKDGEYVTKLIVHLYRLDGHFGVFLCPEETFFYPPLMSFNQSHNRLAHFFLDHAYREKLTFKGQRIADVRVFCRSRWFHPCQMANWTYSPSILQLLLQYGSLLTEKTLNIFGYPVSEQRVHPDAEIVTCSFLLIAVIIHKFLIGIENTDDPDFKELKLWFDVTVQCVNLMLRVCTHIRVSYVCKINWNWLPFLSVEKAFRWLAENGVPELIFRSFVPMTLRHACRLAIRISLHDNWQLPRGIDELPIPMTLKGFLNLCSD